MTKAAFWINVAQLVVAVVALNKQAPVCPTPSTHHHPAHHHRTHHRPPHGGLHRIPDRRAISQA